MSLLVLVTGANGFIGRRLIKKLKKDDYNIIGLDIAPNKHTHICDITIESQIIDIFKKYKPTIIIHLAALSSTQKSYKEAILTQKINYMGTINLLEVATKFNSDLEYFLFASTAEVYGGRFNHFFHEMDKTNPRTPYSVSKLAAENYIKMRAIELGLKTCCVRFCNTYGRLNNFEFLIEYIFHSFFRGISPSIRTPNSIREFFYVPDHINVYKLILENQPTGTINASSGEVSSILEVAERIKNIVGSKQPIKCESSGNETSIILDSSLLRKMGFKTSYSLESGLKDYYNRLLNQKKRSSN